MDQGFWQKENEEYDEISVPVVRYSSQRFILGCRNDPDMEVNQMDVKTTFLNGNLEEAMCMRQPKRFETKDHPGRVWKLEKNLYGLKQA